MDRIDDRTQPGLRQGAQPHSRRDITSFSNVDFNEPVDADGDAIDAGMIYLYWEL